MSTTNRRDFMKGSLMATAAVAASGVSGQPVQSSLPMTKDFRYLLASELGRPRLPETRR